MQTLRKQQQPGMIHFLFFSAWELGGGGAGQGAQDLPVASLEPSSLMSKTVWESKDLSARRGLTSNKVCVVWLSLLPVPIYSPGTVQGHGSAGTVKSPQEDCRKVGGRHQNSSKLVEGHLAESRWTSQHGPRASRGALGQGLGRLEQRPRGKREQALLRDLHVIWFCWAGLGEKWKMWLKRW